MLDMLKGLFSSGPKVDIASIVHDGAFLVDVRTTGEFSDDHVKGSVNIPLDKVGSQLAKFKDKKHIIVFCRSGARSSQAKAILENNGFTNVVNGGSWLNMKQYVK